jgi:outer membrane lipoprotein-sorting protein
MKYAIIALLYIFLVLPSCYGQELSPELLIAKLEETVNKITDYQCRLFEWGYKGPEYEKKTLNFYFKSPAKIRVDIIEGNRLFDAGSVAVFAGGNLVEGKKGGLLSGFVAKLDKKDPLIASVRGTAIDEIGLQGILVKLKFHLMHSAYTVCNMGDGVYCLTAIVNDPSLNGGVSKEVLYLDKTTLLPIKMEGFEGDKQVVYAEWSSYIFNAGLPPELFNMNYDLSSLKKLGIAILEDK